MRIVPGEIQTAALHGYLLGSIGPRPICFASTIDENGQPNLSPFSFFNVFGSKPPIVVFSPARRVRDNSTKHTLQNAQLNGEVVINVVNYDLVQQVNLSSCEYPKGINEFEKAGLTAIASEFVKPFRVKESPVQLECKVLQILETGQEGGAGNLIICEVLCMHLHDEILDASGKIDPHKIDLVARMGGDYYCRASGSAVFEVAKPNMQLGMGFDALPAKIKNSHVLTGNHLGQLANCTTIPQWDEAFVVSNHTDLETQAMQYLDHHDVESAWQVLLRML